MNMNDIEQIKLNEYIKNIETHDITIINGLKSSGKYQLMMQLINILENTYKKKTLYLNCNEIYCLKDFENIENAENINDDLSYLDEINKNIDDEKYDFVFINEITKFKDFASIFGCFLNRYDFKLILTGTQTESLMIANSYYFENETYQINMDRSVKECYENAKREENNKELSFQNYIDKYIVDNIYQAHENFEGERAYPPELTEIYSYEQLKQEIYDILISKNIVKIEEIDLSRINTDVDDVVFGYKTELSIIVCVLCNQIKLAF